MMATPINMALYRMLLKMGANESEAEDAARIDASELATKTDLAELKGAVQAELAVLRWMVGTLIVLVLLVLGRIWIR
jgi:hypothetical protein